MQIVIEAYIGTGFMGDVAVDDIIVASGGCAVHPVDAARKETPNSHTINTHTELLSTTLSPGPYDCLFETDLCSWSSNIGEVRTCLCTLVHKTKVAGIFVNLRVKLCVYVSLYRSNIKILSIR